MIPVQRVEQTEQRSMQTASFLATSTRALAADDVTKESSELTG